MEPAQQEKSPRQRILDTAMRLFFSQGYLATGINQIIEEAEVCKASFYSNFPSKDDLCVEYIKVSHEKWMDLLQKEVSKQKKSYDQLMAIFMFLENWMEACSYRGCGLMNISSEVPETKGKIRRMIQERNGVLKATISMMVSQLKKSDRRYKALNVEDVAGFMMMIVQGAVALSQAHANAIAISHARKNFKRFLDSYVAEV
ncbi:MAG: TetR/AcrR family transcriptional regulator [Candidatus Omnitrophica bacterium]|nr:TetR/AcrR family transcriptional regulator [Candidatus Omnitrophota bacterium]